MINIIMENLISIVIVILTITITCLVVWLIVRKIKRNTKNLYRDFSNGKYTVKFYRYIGDKYVEIDTKKIEISNNKFRYNGKDFSLFDMKKIAFTDKKSNNYAFDYDTMEQLIFKSKKSILPKTITLDDIDTYVNRGIIAQLVAGLEELKGKGDLFKILIGIIIGCAIGIPIGIIVSGNFSREVIIPTTKIILGLI